MPSPRPFRVNGGRVDAESRRLLNQCLTMSGPRNMTTTLFNYQKVYMHDFTKLVPDNASAYEAFLRQKSVWKMLQRETFPQNVLATDFLQCRSADGGRPYWLEMTTGKLYNDPQYWADGTGYVSFQCMFTLPHSTYSARLSLFRGVICEVMGTGKTCIW